MTETSPLPSTVTPAARSAEYAARLTALLTEKLGSRFMIEEGVDDLVSALADASFDAGYTYAVVQHHIPTEDDAEAEWERRSLVDIDGSRYAE